MIFLADENFPLLSVRQLRQAGHDVAAIIEDSPGVSDAEVLAGAVVEQRVILTFDRDYGDLIYRLQLARPAGIVYFRFDPLTSLEPALMLLSIVANDIALEQRFTVIERDDLRQRPM